MRVSCTSVGWLCVLLPGHGLAFIHPSVLTPSALNIPKHAWATRYREARLSATSSAGFWSDTYNTLGVEQQAREFQREIFSVTANPRTDVAGLLDLVERHLSNLDPENCGAILNRLSKLGGPGLRLDSRFHALLGKLDTLDHGWSPKACSMVLNSLGRMGLPASPGLLRRLRDRLFDDMALLPFPQALQPRHLSLSLNGFLHQDFNPGAPFLRRVLAVSRYRAEAFSTQELSTLLHCLGRLRPTTSATASDEADSGRTDAGLSELEAVFVARLPEATAQDVANGIFGLGKLHASSSFSSPSSSLSPLSLDRCLDALLRLLPTFKDAELAMALQGMGLLGAHPSSAITLRLADALSSRLPFFSPQMAVTSLQGLAKMGHLPAEDTWRAWSDQLSGRLGSYKPQELVTLVRACAHMRGKAAALEAVEMLVLRALDHAQRQIKEFKGVELASLVHGLGSLQVFPREELLVPLVAQVEATLHECNAQGLANLMAGFGRLGLYPGDALSLQLEAGLSGQLSALSGKDVSDMLSGWAELGQAPDAHLYKRVMQRAADVVGSLDAGNLVRMLESVATLAPLMEKGEGEGAEEEGVMHAGYAWAEARRQQGRMNDAARGLLALCATWPTQATPTVLHRLTHGLDDVEHRPTEELVGVAWALGRLTHGPTSEAEEGGLHLLPPALAWELERRMAVGVVSRQREEQMEVRDVARVLTAFLRLGHAPAPSTVQSLEAGLLQRLESEAQAEGGQPLTPLYPLVSLLNGLVTLHGKSTYSGGNGGLPLPLRRAFVSRLAGEVSRACPHDVAASVNALARMQWDMDSQDDSLAYNLRVTLDETLRQRAHTFGPSACVLLAGSLAQLNYRPSPPALSALFESIASQAEALEVAGVVCVLESMASLGYSPRAPTMAALAEPLAQRLTADEASPSSTGEEHGAETLVKLTRAFLRLRYHPGPAFLQSLETALLPFITRGRRLAWACMALGTFSHAPSHVFLSRLEASVRARAATLSLGQLSAILWGLAVMSVPPKSSVFSALIAAVSHRLECGGLEVGSGDGEEEPRPLEECDLDSLSVHRRLREAAAYVAEGRGADVEDIVTLVRRVDGFYGRCHEWAPSVAAEPSPNVRQRVRELLKVGLVQEMGGKAAQGKEEGLPTFLPDFVAVEGEQRTGVVLLERAQVLLTADGSHRTVGGSAFRIRMLKRPGYRRVMGLDSVVGILASDLAGAQSRQ